MASAREADDDLPHVIYSQNSFYKHSSPIAQQSVAKIPADFDVELKEDDDEKQNETEATKYFNESQNDQCCKDEKLIRGDKIFCPCLERIEKVLAAYHEVMIKNDGNTDLNDIVSQLQTDIQKRETKDYHHQQLFDDFSHVALVHIDPNKVKFKRRHRSTDLKCKLHCVACIVDRFEKKFPCQIEKCKGFLRHSKDRSGVKHSVTSRKDDVFKQECDKIHSYFFHSTIKLGTECSPDDIEAIDEIAKGPRFTKAYDEDKEEGKEEEKNEKQQKQLYVGRIQDDKWFDAVEAPDEKNILKKQSEHEKNKIYESLVSHIGVFRWQNPHGFKESQNQEFLHQKAKFHNIKDEVLNNEFFKLEIDKWNETIRKSKIFCKSIAARKIRSKYKSFYRDEICNLSTEWGVGEQITLQEVITLKLYTDFDRLQFELKKCFRLQTLRDILKREDANGQNTKHYLLQRLENFYHWRIGLLVLLSKYGTKFNDENMTLYHGVNTKMLLRPSANQAFNGPLSTSSSYHVARTFATAKGMVLTITSYAPRQNFCNAFDCGLISDYPEEQEWLIGFLYVRILRISTRELGSNACKNYVQLLKTLPISSLTREMFFAVHLFKEQIFSMSEHLERIINQFLKVDTFVCCEDKESQCKSDDWSKCSLLLKICALGARHPKGLKKFEEHMNNTQAKKQWEQENFGDMKEEERKEKLANIRKMQTIIPVLWDKFISFALKPNDSYKIKLDVISDRLKPHFMEQINGKWRIDFRKITKVFKNVKEIQFINRYILDDNVLKKFVKQITPETELKVTKNTLQEKNTIEKISFLYFEGDFDDDTGKPSNSEIFKDPDTLNEDEKNKLKHEGWTISKSRPRNGFKILIQKKAKR